MPATDPAAPDAPKVLESMRGVHPRLLFTQQEIDALKPAIEADPILKDTAAGIVTQAKRPQKLSGNPPDIVKSDTPAIVTSGSRLPALAYAWGAGQGPEDQGGHRLDSPDDARDAALGDQPGTRQQHGGRQQHC